MLAIRLPDDIEQRLAELARKTGRTKTFYAREAILTHLEELEDRYLAEERLAEPAKRWSHEALKAETDPPERRQPARPAPQQPKLAPAPPKRGAMYTPSQARQYQDRPFNRLGEGFTRCR